MGYLGVLIGSVLWIILIVAMFGGPGQQGGGAIFLGFASMILFPYLGWKGGNVLQEQIRISRIEKKEKLLREIEAERQKLNSIRRDKIFCIEAVEHSSTLVKSLPESLRHANSWIDKAETEFKENAYAPFWDAVESAAQNLGEYDSYLKQLREYCELYNVRYKGLLKTSPSDVLEIPSFSIDISDVPLPLSTCSRFDKVVRKGQTEFQFANIYEHRMTRQVLIAGFRTLGEAISNLSNQLNYQFGQLKNAIEEQIVEQHNTQYQLEMIADDLKDVKSDLGAIDYKIKH